MIMAVCGTSVLSVIFFIIIVTQSYLVSTTSLETFYSVALTFFFLHEVLDFFSIVSLVCFLLFLQLYEAFYKTSIKIKCV